MVFSPRGILHSKSEKVKKRLEKEILEKMVAFVHKKIFRLKITIFLNIYRSHINISRSHPIFK